MQSLQFYEEVHLPENTLFYPEFKVTRNVAQYPLHHVTYKTAKFKVGTSNGLGEDTISRNVTDAWPGFQKYEINITYFSKEKAGIKMKNTQRFCLEQKYTVCGAWFQYLVIPQLFASVFFSHLRTLSYQCSIPQLLE